MPTFFLPEGRWRIWMRYTDENVKITEAYVNFDIVEYSSERQKNKIG